MAIQWPLLIFSVFLGISSGIFVFLGIGELKGKFKEVRFIAALIALICIAIGGCVSVLHMGHPARATHLLGNLGSGLTKELSMNETMDRTLAQNLMEFCENRACVYQFLSRCYEVEIDANSAKQITQGFSFSSDDEALNQAIEAMKQDLADASEAHLEQLAVVFNRVFFGMGPRTAQKAFPYESVYTSEQGIMMQEAYSAVAKVYREARLKKNPNFPEPEDHLAVECAFMAHLCTACILTLETADEVLAEKFLQAQQNFLRDHLLNWITPFVADAKQSAEEGFYWHLASFTEGFLRQDSTALEEVLGWADVVGSR